MQISNRKPPALKENINSSLLDHIQNTIQNTLKEEKKIFGIKFGTLTSIVNKFNTKFTFTVIKLAQFFSSFYPLFK